MNITAQLTQFTRDVEASLAQFKDEAGEVIEDAYPAYDEAKADWGEVALDLVADVLPKVAVLECVVDQVRRAVEDLAASVQACVTLAGDCVEPTNQQFFAGKARAYETVGHQLATLLDLVDQ